jgi:L-ascorbate metabolism protein UlaG (beta-lactamase superfamily)
VLGERGHLVAQEDIARLFDNRIVSVQPVRLHEPVLLSRARGEFVARCVPSSDGLGSPQVSWIVDGGGKRIIHCGDTSWHGGWWNIARAYGPFDAAFVPINGFRQSGGMFEHVEQPMSLTPEQAALASQILGARVVVPIHFGSKGDTSYVEESQALARFNDSAKKRGLIPRALAPGEIIAL